VQDYLAVRYGEPSDKVYNDWDGIGEVTSLPDEAAHREVDKIVLAAGSAGRVKTAIVCPPTIYGPGRGPGNQRSIQFYYMARATLQRGKGFHVGAGKNKWTRINVHDLSKLFLLLFEAALDPEGGKATWGPEGYYFCEAGDFVWGDVAKQIAEEACSQGFIKTPDVESISAAEANEILPGGSGQWGMNSRCSAIRARKLFDWQPSGPGVDELLPSIVQEEAEDLGLLKTHADLAAGV
jgi:nucleoside-diphosphate-sugar epimerase